MSLISIYIIFLIENSTRTEEHSSEHVSLQSLSELMQGSKVQMIRMTTVFLNQIETDFNVLKLALNENDMDQISKITHKLKSSFKLFGLNKTGVLLERIEQRAKTLDRHELNSELQIILSMQPRLTYLVQKELNQLILSNSNS